MFKFHVTPVRMAKKNKTIDNKCYFGCGDPDSLVVGMQIGIATLEINIENLQQLNTNLPHDPVISCLDIYPKELASYSTYPCSSVFSVPLFTIARKEKRHKCASLDEYIMKMWYITQSNTIQL